MNMNKNYLVALALLFSAIVSVSCNNDDPEPNFGTKTDVMTPEMNIKFVSASGTNVVDSLNFLESYGDKLYCEITSDDDIIKVSCVRESDGKEVWAGKKHVYDGTIVTMDIYRYGWFRPVEGALTEREGTLLELGWADPVASLSISDFDDYPWKRPENYDDSYTIKIQSPTIFGNDKIHTIKWYVHIIYKHYDTYRCEVDGVEFDFKNLPEYIKHHRYHGDNYPRDINEFIVVPICVD